MHKKIWEINILENIIFHLFRNLVRLGLVTKEKWEENNIFFQVDTIVFFQLPCLENFQNAVYKKVKSLSHQIYRDELVYMWVK